MTWLQTQLTNNPHKLFIQEGNNQYSYSNVMDMVATYSKALLKEGIQTKDRILIYLPSGVELVEIMLACFEISAVAVPISLKLTEKERNAIIEKIEPKLIIANWELKPALIS